MKGNCTRYRDKIAAAMGDLAEIIEKECGALYLNADPPPHSLPLSSFTNLDNDLKNLPKEAESSSNQNPKSAAGTQRHWRGWPGHFFRRCPRHLALSGTVYRP